MDQLMAYFEQNLMVIFGAAALLVPVIFLFRKYVLPAVFYTVEFAIYMVVMHTVVYGTVRLFAWFQSESAWRDGYGNPIEEFVPLQTPWITNFWDRTLYSPEWLFYAEGIAAVVILYIVIKFRPLGFGSKYRRKAAMREARQKADANRRALANTRYANQR